MKATLKELPAHHPEIEIIEINHDEDHIHLLLWIPPKMAIGRVVAILKSNTARHLKKKFPFLKEVYWGTDGIWSDSYFVSTVGVNEEIIRRYIEHQGREDAGQHQLKLV
jgi:putative transposase